uniref:Uncharacterized protein n=1 Tax=Arundo donax TaxID=35708 RepID=A0A0A9AXS8_ARUDO
MEKYDKSTMQNIEICKKLNKTESSQLLALTLLSWRSLRHEHNAKRKIHQCKRLKPFEFYGLVYIGAFTAQLCQ